MKKKQIRRAGFTLALLISAFFLTSFYLASANLDVQTVGGNIFATETMKIGLDGNVPDGQTTAIAFIDANDQAITKIEPGMTLRGSFTVKNESTFAVYYRLYFTGVSGELADVLQASIKDGNTVLCGPVTVSELTDVDCFRANYSGADNAVLNAGQTRMLQLELYFPKETGNTAQGKSLSCSLRADMTQVKNQDANNIDFSMDANS